MERIWETTKNNDRFDPSSGQRSMKAVVTAANGGYEKFQYRIVRIPRLEDGEVLLQVLAAGVNNTDINTRIGWYSSSITTGTNNAVNNNKQNAADNADGGWNTTSPFPFIQGTDCCGRIIEVAPGGDKSSIGSRVLVRSCMRKSESTENVWMGSDFDGSFAQYVKAKASEVFIINCNWTDAELGTIPCSYGTAENMLHRGNVNKDEKILITGASGGVGSAVVQLAKRRGAAVTAITSKTKFKQIRSIGADIVFDREEDLVSKLGEEFFDIIIDNVAGNTFGDLLKLLKRNGRYVSSGAIGGPIVTFDMRTFYLKDLKMIGCTAWDEPVFPNLISYIENGEIQPLLAKTFKLEQIAEAQKEFLKKTHVGKIVLIPPEDNLNLKENTK